MQFLHTIESESSSGTRAINMSVARNSDSSPGLHRIVVVGGGAGGLELATRLGDKLAKRGKAAVTLIEKTRAHFWKPHLHEIASGRVLPVALFFALGPIGVNNMRRQSVHR
jgi:2-polyprenyl-6-methoxyphenol hydroxylase-like FAD-dependent oxidoreductase